MKTINNDTINFLVDSFDEATMLYYNGMINEEKDNTAVTNYDLEKGRLNYYECLLKVIDAYLGDLDLNSSHLDEEIVLQIETIFNKIESYINKIGINTEEMRKALLLLDIKGFKNLNYSLDLITPDNIGLIIAKLIEGWFNEEKKINIMDFNFGIGNLMFTIANHLNQNINIIGLDNHILMANISAHKGNMLQSDLTIYHQDALEYLPTDVDLVVSDLATYEYINPNYHSALYDEDIRYFPYLAIEHYLSSLNNNEENKYMRYIYIIDNDFFSQKGSDKFKILLDNKASIKAFVVLPSELFQQPALGKALLILDNQISLDKHIPIYMLPSFNNKNAFLDTMAAILKSLKGIN